jgi:hypothetical protein
MIAVLPNQTGESDDIPTPSTTLRGEENDINGSAISFSLVNVVIPESEPDTAFLMIGNEALLTNITWLPSYDVAITDDFVIIVTPFNKDIPERAHKVEIRKDDDGKYIAFPLAPFGGKCRFAK